jgi:hypothetical protein
VPILSALRIETVMRSGFAGFDQKIVGAGPHRLHRGIDAALGRQYDHRQFVVRRAQPRQYRDAVDIGHHQIQQDKRNLLSPRPMQQVERRPAARRGYRRHACLADRRFQKPALNRIVVDDEDRLRHLFLCCVVAHRCSGKVKAALSFPLCDSCVGKTRHQVQYGEENLNGWRMASGNVDYWAFFADDARRTGSALYARLAQGVCGDDQLRALAAHAKPGQPTRQCAVCRGAIFS